MERPIKRRDFNTTLAASTALALLAARPAAAQGAAPDPAATGDKPIYTMLIYPGMILQDLVGPMTVFNLTMGDIRLVCKDRTPVPTEVGLPVPATHTFDNCPRDGDVLFVPGGLGGSIALMEDAATLDFLRDMAGHVGHVTSVCTGALVLGAAGLLRGKRATSHWYVRDVLATMGATPVEARVVEDGNTVTGGGVTAGLDFGLTLAARLRGEDWAKRITLTLEYAPEPPFVGGTPARADPADVEAVLSRRGPVIAEARAAAERVAATF